jgi:hypothetical protein
MARYLYYMAILLSAVGTLFFGVFAIKQRWYDPMPLPQPTDATMLFFICLIALIMLVILPKVMPPRK